MRPKRIMDLFISILADITPLNLVSDRALYRENKTSRKNGNIFRSKRVDLETKSFQLLSAQTQADPKETAIDRRKLSKLRNSHDGCEDANQDLGRGQENEYDAND